MLSFTENFTTFGPNAEKTEYLLEFEISVQWKMIFRRLYTAFILRA